MEQDLGLLERGSCGYGAIGAERWPYGFGASLAAQNSLQGLTTGWGGCGTCLEVECSAADVHAFSGDTNQVSLPIYYADVTKLNIQVLDYGQRYYKHGDRSVSNRLQTVKTRRIDGARKWWGTVNCVAVYHCARHALRMNSYQAFALAVKLNSPAIFPPCFPACTPIMQLTSIVAWKS